MRLTVTFHPIAHAGTDPHGRTAASSPARPPVVDLRAAHAACTLDEVVRFAARQGGAPSAGDDPIWVDGSVRRGSCTLLEAGARSGSAIEVGIPPAVRPTDADDVVTVQETGGADAGRRHRLPVGTHLIGRDPNAAIVLASATVSRRHASVTVAPDGSVTWRDLTSMNGSRVGETFLPPSSAVAAVSPIALGAVRVTIAAVEHAERAPRPPTGCPPPARSTPSSFGTTPWNRPPRVAPAPPREPLVAPRPRRHVAGRTPFSWAMVLAPLVLGLVMAKLLGPMFAVFALLSPSMVVASWFEQRRRAARSTRRGAGELASATTQFASDLRAERVHELAHRHACAPDLATLATRASVGHASLWERRPRDADFLVARIGVGRIPWSPRLDRPVDDLPPEARTVLASGAVLPDAPVVVALGPGEVVGLVGDAPLARAVARALVVHTVVVHGPADVRIAVLPSSSGAAMWAFASWLPHGFTPDGVGCVATTPSDTEALSAAVAATAPRRAAAEHRPPAVRVDGHGPLGPVLLTVVDDPAVRRDHDRLQRVLPTGPDDRRSTIVIAPTVDELPAACTTVVQLQGGDGAATVARARTGDRLDDVLVDGMSEAVALDVARALARFRDPEVPPGQASLPPCVTLATTLGDLSGRADDLSAATVLRRWAQTDGSSSAPVHLGLTTDGPLVVDLVADGPHALIGGTTGAGKSELLRSLIVSLAATIGPDHLTFVLVDYKGGSAFDPCACLPHTVGLVTDLDEHLAARALQSLEAELRHRETRLRTAGAVDLPAYERWRRAQPATERPDPIARLVVVIDEFASMATDVPDFLEALVSIAQRGRSLGMHLVLATQRPHGAISDRIRTNTNIRIALRVLDAADSTDVIGAPDAASISRSTPGRAYVRLGPDELRVFQATQASAPHRSTADASVLGVPGALVLLDPYGRPRATSDHHSPADPKVERTDLDVLVSAISQAYERQGSPAIRRPWLPPLPALVDLDQLAAHTSRPTSTIATARTWEDGLIGEAVPIGDGADGWRLAIGLLDDPARQRQQPLSWAPRQGNLIVYGMPGTGATTALLTVAAAAAASRSPDSLHLYAIDAGAHHLDPLLALPHTGAVIALDERTRQQRLVRRLRDECAARRRRPDRHVPSIIVVIDGFGTFRGAHDDLAGLDLLDRLGRLALEGPAVGIHLAISAERPQAVPAALAAATNEKLLLHLPDSYDHRLCGMRAAAAVSRPGRPGRALTIDGLEVQIARVAAPGDALATALTAIGARWPVTTAPPPILELPAQVSSGACGAADLEGAVWRLPLGLGDRDLGPRSFTLHDGEHALITGPARSGRTTLLTTLADHGVRAGAAVVLLSPRADRSISDRPVPAVVRVSSVPALVDAVRARRGRRVLVLIDDAELVADEDAQLDQLLTAPDPCLRVIATGRADRLRTAYGHWSRRARDSGQGLALRPDLDSDGDLWGVRLPRRPPTESWPPGRGLLVAGGDIELVQVAR